MMKKNHVPVVDLYNTCKIDPNDAVSKETLCPDGLHPNDLGHQRIADKLIGFLRTL